MKNTIYDQHDKAFNLVRAFVVLDNQGGRVATIAFKFPKDGAGRLSCYLHVIGLEMVKGIAGGYGYDKRTAAFLDVAKKQVKVKQPAWLTKDILGDKTFAECYAKEFTTANAILSSFDDRYGYDWQDNLRVAGFKVLQAV